jgi:hypothetical protein
MAHSVIITTPMPTLDELGKNLRLTKAEQKFIIRLVDEKTSRRSTADAVNPQSASSRPKKNQIRQSSSIARKAKSRARKTA